MVRKAVVGLLVLVVLLSGCAGAATVGPEERARRIEAEVWSPYCPGRLLADCTTRQALELRERVLERVRSGETEEEVLAWLRSNFGEEVLARPQDGAAAYLIWLFPAVLLLGGGLGLGIAVRRWSSRPPSPPAPALDPEDPWLRKLREELERET